MSKNRIHQLSIALSSSTFNSLKQLADQRGESITQIIKSLIYQELEQEESNFSTLEKNRKNVEKKLTAKNQSYKVTEKTENFEKKLKENMITPYDMQNWLNVRPHITQKEFSQFANVGYSTMSNFMNDIELQQARKSTRRKLTNAIKKYEQQERNGESPIKINHPSKRIEKNLKNPLTGSNVSNSSKKHIKTMTIYFHNEKRVVDAFALSQDASLLKALRAKAGLTQQQVADGTGIPRQTFPSYETGKRNMRVDTATTLFDFLYQKIYGSQSVSDFQPSIKRIEKKAEKPLTTEENQFNFTVKNRTKSEYMRMRDLTMSNFNVEELPIYFSRFGLTNNQFAKIINKRADTIRQWFLKNKTPQPANVGLMINALRDLEAGKIDPDDFK